MARETEGRPEPVTAAMLRDWALPGPGVGKEARGRTLVVGGSVRTPGAVLLAGEAVLRCGAGKLQVVTARSVATAVAVAIPEALVLGLPETGGGDISPDAAGQVVELADDCASVLLGPGMSDPQVCTDLVAAVVPRLRGTVVLDALGLAFVGAEPAGLHCLDGRAVLTPNPKELARALDVDPEDVDDDPFAHAGRLAATARAVVACGGAESWTAAPDGRIWLDRTGGVGLGVSGSGDVRAGIVTGLAARGAEPAQAAVWGTYVHGRAGDRLASQVGRLGFLARELLPEVPRVLSEIEV